MIGIIIQARMSSKRLPGKVLKKLAGKEVLWHTVTRCQKSKFADKIIVATSTTPSDNKIVNFCSQYNILLFRGNLNNVLKRFYDTAKKEKLDVIVRITADCPLIDPSIIDGCIKLYLKNSIKASYVSNSLNRIFPRGLDVEVFSFKALETAYLKSTEKNQLEHVTPYIIEHQKKIAYNVSNQFKSDCRLTIDNTKDFRLFQHIYKKFYRANNIISVPKIISYLRRNPKIANINKPNEQKNIKAIAIFGGGLKQDKKNGPWRTTNYDESGGQYGLPGDRLRILAGALLYKNNPTNSTIIAMGGIGQMAKIKGIVPLAKILREELIKLDIPRHDIIMEQHSGSTHSQLIELKKIIKDKYFQTTKIISNEWHLPRIKAIIDNKPSLKKFYSKHNIEFISAEKILVKFDNQSWKTIVKKAYQSTEMKKNICPGKKGIKQIKNGSYTFKTKYC